MTRSEKIKYITEQLRDADKLPLADIVIDMIYSILLHA